MIIYKVIICYGIFWWLPTIAQESTEEDSYHYICEEPECKEKMVELFKKIDYQAKPCIDFYQYVCGNDIKTATIPDGKETSKNKNYTIDDNIRSLLQQNVSSSNSKALNLVLAFHQSCINITSINEKGYKPLREYFDDTGGIPVITKDWNEANFDWKNYTKTVFYRGVPLHGIVKYTVEIDKKTSNYMLNLDEAMRPISVNFTLPIEELVKTEYFQNALNVTKHLKKLEETNEIDNKINETEIKNELEEALRFEKTLVNISYSAEERKNLPSINHITISEFANQHPYLNWLDFINSLLNGYHKVDNNTIINVKNTAYFHKLGCILNTTSKRDQANFFYMRTLYQYDSLVKEMNGFNYSKLEYCICMVKAHMPIALAASYIQNYDNENTRNTIDSAFEYVRQEFRDGISKLDWINKTARDYALKKLDTMERVIGYANELTDETVINDYYENIDLSPTNYFFNMMKILAVNYAAPIKSLNKTVEKFDLLRHSEMVFEKSSPYLPEENIFYIQMYVVSQVFYKNVPKIYTFPMISNFIVMHLLAIFNEKNRQLFENGTWWTNETNNKYLEKIKCVEELFYNVKDKESGLKLNSNKTVQSNIIRLVGFKYAYRAYKKWISDHSLSQLPFHDWNDDKFFYIVSVANQYCMKTKPSYIKKQIQEPTIPYKYLFNGILSVTEDFATTFNCKPSAKMNKGKKCEIW